MQERKTSTPTHFLPAISYHN